ncbi:MAG TPA: hypothetical protein VHP58_01775 [Alphaproteobacteria bacterium]|nr:hypothetical protein [Alphaproteobacteria bacterium]
MNKTILTTTAALLLGACSSMGGGASGVQQIGKDSYTVRATSEKSASAAKQAALKQANDYCATQKRNVQLVKEYAGTESDTGEKFDDVTFLCVGTGDADFVRVKPEALTKE